MSLFSLRNYWWASIIFASLLFNYIQHNQKSSLVNTVKLCEANSALLQAAITQAQAETAKQAGQVRLREQEAADRALLSQKRTDEIMSTDVSKDCNAAIQWGLNQVTQVYP